MASRGGRTCGGRTSACACSASSTSGPDRPPERRCAGSGVRAERVIRSGHVRPLRAILLVLLLGALFGPAQPAQAVPGKLRIVIEGQGTVTGDFGTFCSGPGACEFPASVGRNLQAQERSGYVFQSWTGCRAGTGG